MGGRGSRRAALPPGSAGASPWAVENKLSLGQVVVREKSNEITAIPQLLQFLEISGALIMIDAMGCQREIADQIRQREGDYVLGVKPNQPKLYEQVEGAIDEALEQDAEKVDEHVTVETGHGRHETRTYAIIAAPESVDPDKLWRDLKAVGIAISEREDPRGRASIETRYYILSRLLPVRKFAEAVRGHWGIENNLHWQLDVSFREDECRVSRDHAPANLNDHRLEAGGFDSRLKARLLWVQDKPKTPNILAHSTFTQLVSQLGRTSLVRRTASGRLKARDFRSQSETLIILFKCCE